MPVIKSKAQRRKFAELLVEGKITAAQFERANKEAGTKDLPEHASKKRSRKKAAKRKAK